MNSVRIKGRTGRMVSVPQNAIDALVDAFHGKLVQPSSPEYNPARSVWNALVDRRPALIARCASAQDVVQVVRLAATHDLLVSVRGGGYEVAGSAVCDDG